MIHTLHAGGPYTLAFILERSASATATTSKVGEFLAKFQAEPYWAEIKDYVTVLALSGNPDFHARPNEYNFLTSDPVAPWIQSQGVQPRETFLLVPDSWARSGPATIRITEANWRDVILHEMGHAVAGLADEYWSGTASALSIGGIGEGIPNITGERDPAKVKWRHLFSRSPPTIRFNPRPGQPVASYPMVPADDLGLYEGGHGWAFDVFRPTKDACKMAGDVTRAFCPVCREAMVRAYRGGAAPVPAPAPTPPPPTTTVCPTCKGTGKVTVQA